MRRIANPLARAFITPPLPLQLTPLQKLDKLLNSRGSKLPPWGGADMTGLTLVKSCHVVGGQKTMISENFINISLNLKKLFF